MRTSQRINTTGLLVHGSGATERTFRRMELLEFEEEEKNNAPIDIVDDDNYDDADLFFETDDEQEYDLCSSCHESLIAHLVQPFGHMVCTNGVKKNNCQLCGCFDQCVACCFPVTVNMITRCTFCLCN